MSTRPVGGATRTADPRSLREIIDALGAAAKTPRGVSVYSVRVNRVGGRWIAAVAYKIGMTPNQVTVLSGLVSAAGILGLAALHPSVPLGVACSLALVLGFMLDSADGQVARLRRMSSPAGEWLDHCVDAACKLGLHAAVLVAWLRLDYADSRLLLPLAFQFVAVLFFFGGTLAGVLRHRAAELPGATAVPSLRDRVAPVVLLPVDHGVVALMFMTWGWQGAFTGVYTASLALHVLYSLVFARHWFQELNR